MSTTQQIKNFIETYMQGRTTEEIIEYICSFEMDNEITSDETDYLIIWAKENF